MEHIHPDDLEASFREISRVTNCYICKICTRPSKAKGIDGEDLHPIVKPLEWWQEQFKKYFRTVTIEDGLLICKK